MNDSYRSKDLYQEIERYFHCIDEEARSGERTLSFGSESQLQFNEWVIANENNARFGEHPSYWESHLGKQSKAVAVLVIILHRLQELQSTAKSDAISLETLHNALELQQYFEAHARRCYESISGTTAHDAKTILDLLKEKRLPEKFKSQDIYHMGLRGLSDSNQVRAALTLLQDFGWLAMEKIPGKSGRHHEFWILHPRAFEKN